MSMDWIWIDHEMNHWISFIVMRMLRFIGWDECWKQEKIHCMWQEEWCEWQAKILGWRIVLHCPW